MILSLIQEDIYPYVVYTELFENYLQSLYKSFAHRIIPSSGSTSLEDSRKLIKEAVSSVEVNVEDWNS